MSKEDLHTKLIQLFMDAKYDRENPTVLAQQVIDIVYEDENRRINSLAKLIMYVQKLNPIERKK